MSKSKKDSKNFKYSETISYIFLGTFLVCGTLCAIYVVNDINNNKNITEYKYAVICGSGAKDVNYYGEENIVKKDFKEYELYPSVDKKSLIIFVYDTDKEKALLKANFIKDHLLFNEDNEIYLNLDLSNLDSSYIYYDCEKKKKKRKKEENMSEYDFNYKNNNNKEAKKEKIQVFQGDYVTMNKGHFAFIIGGTIVVSSVAGAFIANAVTEHRYEDKTNQECAAIVIKDGELKIYDLGVQNIEKQKISNDKKYEKYYFEEGKCAVYLIYGENAFDRASLISYNIELNKDNYIINDGLFSDEYYYEYKKLDENGVKISSISRKPE